MGLLIIAALVGVPLIEIALLIEVGGWIGTWPTVALVIATALIGAVLLRQQGLSTLQRAQAEMRAQRLPVRELFDAACLLVAGALLLTPGFVTDAIGFALLVAPLRLVAGLWLWRAVQRRGHVQSDGGGFAWSARHPSADPGTIDAEAWEVDPAPEPDDERPDDHRLPRR